MSKPNVLVVDDQEENLSSTREILQRWQYNVDAVSSGKEAVDCIRNFVKEYSIVLLDYRMPDKNGVEVAKEIRALNSEVILLMYSAYPSVESLTATIRAGILNFIGKDEDLDLLKVALQTACQEYEKVRKIKPPLTPNEASKIIASVGMVGQSESLARVVESVKRIKNTRSPVLIYGESGTGKEVIAHALHTGPKDRFKAVNCAASHGSSIIDSELFGHEKGAFTGAIVRKIGVFEAVQGGTVFLDELHHLDPVTQGKLLRILREGSVRRVGSSDENHIDFRLVCAATPKLDQMAKTGEFLPDLLYRVKCITLTLPPLRTRREDIEPLVIHFCERFYKDRGIRKTFLAKTIRYMEQYDWPGNVGQLQSYVTSLLEETEADTIDESKFEPKHRLDMIAESPASGGLLFQFQALKDKEEKEFVARALQTASSERQAAQKLGISQSSLRSMMKRWGLKKVRCDLVQ